MFDIPENQETYAVGVEFGVVEVNGQTMGAAVIIAHGMAQEELIYPSFYEAVQAHHAPESYDGPEPVCSEDLQ